MSIDRIVNEQGKLADTFAKLDPLTIQHSSEICIDRIDDTSLRDKWFWTAEGAVYTIEDGEVILYLTDRESNPILKNIKEATDQLIQNHNYIPKQEDLEAAINSANTLRIKLSDLKLKRENNEYSYFEINAKKYNELNEVQRAFAERVFGEEDKFKEYMKILNDEGKETTRIYVLNPDYVKDKIKENKAEALARACRLIGFGGNSDFDANGRCVVSSISWLRGAYLKKICELEVGK